MYIERFSGGRDSRIGLSLRRVEVNVAGKVSVWMEKLSLARHFSISVDIWLMDASGGQSVGWEKAQYCSHLVLVRSCNCFRASLLIREPSSLSLIIVSEI